MLLSFLSPVYTPPPVEQRTGAGIFKQSMGARKRVVIGLSYRAVRLHSQAELNLGIDSRAPKKFNIRARVRSSFTLILTSLCRADSPMLHLLAGGTGVYPIIKQQKNCGILPVYYSMLESKQLKLHLTGRSKMKFKYRKNIFEGSPF